MNTKKRNLELMSAIISIILGAFIIFDAIIIIINILKGTGLVRPSSSERFVFDVLLVKLLLLGIPIIVLLCRDPYEDGKIKNTKCLNVTLLILSSIVMFIYILLIREVNRNMYTNIFSYFTYLNYMCIAVIVLTGVSLNLKYHDNMPQSNPPQDKQN